jgi:hypothetical protein
MACPSSARVLFTRSAVSSSLEISPSSGSETSSYPASLAARKINHNIVRIGMIPANDRATKGI